MKTKNFMILPLFTLGIILGGCSFPPGEITTTFDNKLIFEGQLVQQNNAKGDGVKGINIYRDSVTGCRYIAEQTYGGSYTYSPFYNEYGQVDGCYKLLGDSAEGKEDYLKLLAEYYPDRDVSELEYLLESVFDYKNKSFKEVKELLNLMNKDGDVRK